MSPGALTIAHTHAPITLPCSTRELAQALSAELLGNEDLVIERPGAIEDTDAHAVCFIRAASYASMWESSQCAAALVSRGVEITHNDPSRALLIVNNADEAYVKLLAAHDEGRNRPPPGVHERAVIDESASVDRSAAIGPGCVVGARASIGKDCVLMPNAVVGSDTTIGNNTTLEPGSVIDDRCVIGQRCVIGANTVIGSDGFGFLPPTDDRPAIKVPQTGRVIIGDDVELGACVTIDRGKLHDTKVGSRVKVDNQVHIGHNCVIGDDTILCGRTTLGGSCRIGSKVMVGGSVTFNDHASAGDNAKVAGGAIVMDHVPESESYAGIPATQARLALANYGALRDIAPTLRKIEKRIKALEHREQ